MRKPATNAGEAGETRVAGQAGACAFSEVLAYELEAIDQLRRRRGQDRVPTSGRGAYARAHEAGLTALSFSGGGIRSAAFNLGVTAGLARLGLLRRFDYLSMTSGGGYVGGWLAAWIQRAGLDAVEKQLAGRDGVQAATDDAARPPTEPDPVSFLRRFSNYLTPRVGAFSADTWTFVATYLRNLLLTLSILVLALASLLLAPRLVVHLSSVLHADLADGLVPAVALLLLSLVGLGFNLRSLDRPEDPPSPLTGQGGVQLLVVVPLFLSAWMFGLWIWFARLHPNDHLLTAWLSEQWAAFGRLVAGREAATEPLTWGLLAAALYSGVWMLARPLSSLLDRRERRHPPAHEARLWHAVQLTAPVAGGLGGLLLYGVAALSDRLSNVLAGPGGGAYAPWHLFHVNVWKAPAIVLVFLVTAFVQTGLMGRVFPEAYREWWSRLGAWLLIYGITWAGLFGVAIYGPILLIWLGATATMSLGAGWTAISAIGVQIARSLPAAGDGEKPPLWRTVVAAVAPQVFIVGLLAAIALMLHAVLTPPPGMVEPACDRLWHEPGTPLFEVLRCQSQRMWLASEPVAPWLLAPVLLGGAFFLSWRIDINQFSMHLFYRNRLIRTFLGASNADRRAQPFTGFDPADDLPLAALEPAAGRYDGPLPLVNTALNLVAGRELAWQERKAAAFVLSPGYSGFEVGREDDRAAADDKLDAAGYRWTGDYEGGMTLGTAMGISGAAVSAAMGAATRAATAFLLTVFNARLGWWLGNPRHGETGARMGPRLGLLSLLAELFGQTTDRARYVYLSDGGHFDNPGPLRAGAPALPLHRGQRCRRRSRLHLW